MRSFHSLWEARKAVPGVRLSSFEYPTAISNWVNARFKYFCIFITIHIMCLLVMTVYFAARANFTHVFIRRCTTIQLFGFISTFFLHFPVNPNVIFFVGSLGGFFGDTSAIFVVIICFLHTFLSIPQYERRGDMKRPRRVLSPKMWFNVIAKTGKTFFSLDFFQ